MPTNILYTVLTYGIAAVWLANGLLCKVLHLVPRHEQIVARILGAAYAPLLTRAIGVAEIFMAVWVISRLKPRFCALAQLGLIASMNMLEFILAPDLLLWGRLNAVYAGLFMLVIYYQEFVLGKQLASQT
ncbi:MAG: DoxX-like family protein [Janthinobacterium lividum]|jgi:hypothetical protein